MLFIALPSAPRSDTQSVVKLADLAADVDTLGFLCGFPETARRGRVKAHLMSNFSPVF